MNIDNNAQDTAVTGHALEHVALEMADSAPSGTGLAESNLRELVAARIAAGTGFAAEVNVLTEALRQDPEYAWSWHCNVAVAAQDAGMDYAASQLAAAKFLQLLANVDTTQSPHYPATQAKQGESPHFTHLDESARTPSAVLLEALNYFHTARDRDEFYRAFEKYRGTVWAALGIVVKSTKFPSVDDGTTVFPTRFRFDVHQNDGTALVTFAPAPVVVEEHVHVLAPDYSAVAYIDSEQVPA